MCNVRLEPSFTPFRRERRALMLHRKPRQRARRRPLAKCSCNVFGSDVDMTLFLIPFSPPLLASFAHVAATQLSWALFVLSSLDASKKQRENRRQQQHATFLGVSTPRDCQEPPPSKRRFLTKVALAQSARRGESQNLGAFFGRAPQKKLFDEIPAHTDS